MHWDDGLGTVRCIAKLGVASFLSAGGKAIVLVEVFDELTLFHALTRILR